jgi:hypothetical protein
VKELNPGIDLLLAADWDVIFQDRQIEREEPVAPHPGLSVPIPISITTSPSTTLPTQLDGMPGTYVSFEHSSYNLGRPWLVGGIVLAAAAVLISGVSVALWAKRK